MKGLKQLDDTTTVKKAETHLQQDTTHTSLKADSAKKDTIIQHLHPVHHPVFHKDTINIDSLSHLLYKGYLHKIKVHHFSDISFPVQKNKIQQQVTTRPKTYIGKQIQHTYPGWFVFVFISAVLMIGLVKFMQREKIKLLFQSLFKEKLIAQYVEERNSIVSLTDILLWVNYLLSFSVTLYIAFFHFQLHSPIPFSKINFLIVLFSGILLFQGIKFLLLLLSGWLFKINICVKKYALQWSFMHEMTGILLLPLNILLVFLEKGVSYIIYINLIIILLSYIFLLIRGIIISKRHELPLFYIFLYLCTLEILPLIVLFRLLIVY